MKSLRPFLNSAKCLYTTFSASSSFVVLNKPTNAIYKSHQHLNQSCRSLHNREDFVEEFDDDLFGGGSENYNENTFQKPARSHSEQPFSEHETEPRSSMGYGNNTFQRDNISGMDDLFSRISDVSFGEVELSDINKNVYTPHPETVNRSQEELDSFYQQHSISTSANLPRPIFSFDELDITDHEKDRMRRLDISTPTPIQSISIPVALSGQNLIGVAQTGSGKTLSFMLPALRHIRGQPPSSRGKISPSVLVMCPTRELTMQCTLVARRLAEKHVSVKEVYGGVPKSRQYDQLMRGCDVLVATPGRLLDFVSDRVIDLRRCSYLVLDEADNMLDMGFERQIRKIVNQIRPDRQLTLWSATWPESVQELASDYLKSDKETAYLKVGSSSLTANKNVNQQFHICRQADKPTLFQEIVPKIVEEIEAQNKTPKLLIFTNTKFQCRNLEHLLREIRIKSISINGDKNQQQRDMALNAFRNNRVPIMIATDVAARGLDVSNIDAIINYDCPANCVSYIHRIGRTGRAGKMGDSHTILSEEDGAICRDLIRSLKDIDHPVDEKLYKLQSWHSENRRSSRGNSRGGYSKGGYSKGGYSRSRTSYHSRDDRHSRY